MSVTSTTITGNMAPSITAMRVASATGFEVGKIVKVGGELMKVTSVSGLLIGVFRGFGGTKALLHTSGQAAIVGSPSDFPYSVTPNLNVTVSDVKDGMHHITTASFTALLVGAVTNANLAIGKLLFTLPAGPIIVKSETMSVAILGSTANCNADTPDMGLGTTIGSGAQTVLSGVGAAAENLLTGQTATVNSTTITKTVATELAIEATGDKTVYLNIADDWAGVANISVTGTVILEWVELA